MPSLKLTSHSANFKSHHSQQGCFHRDNSWNFEQREDVWGFQKFGPTLGHPVESRKLLACLSCQLAILIESQLSKSVALRKRKRLPADFFRPKE